MIRRKIPLGLNVIIIVQTSADYCRTSRIDPAYHYITGNALTAMPARGGVEVLLVICTRTAEDHDGFRKDLGRPVIVAARNRRTIKAPGDSINSGAMVG